MTLRFTAGDMTIHRIIEMEGAFIPALDMIAGLTPEVLGGEPLLAAADLRSIPPPDTLAALLPDLRRAARRSTTIVVDTCIGNDKPRPIPPWNML